MSVVVQENMPVVVVVNNEPRIIAVGYVGGGSSAAVWGSITGTLSNQTDLQNALNAKQPLASVLTNTTASFTTTQETKLAGIEARAEVNAVNSVSGKTGDVGLDKDDVGLGNVDNTSDADKPVSTAAQIEFTAIQRFNSGTFINQISGGALYTYSPSANGMLTNAGAAGRLDLGCGIFKQNVTTATIGIQVSTGVASATGRVCVYSAGADGMPDQKIYESASDLDFSTIGSKMLTAAVNFEANKIYWFGLLSSSTATVRAIPFTDQPNLGILSTTSSAFYVSLRRTGLTYGNPLPSSFNFTSSDLINSVNPPAVQWTVA